MTADYRRTIFLVSTALIAGLAVAGCSAGSSSSDSAPNAKAADSAARAVAPDAGGATAQDNPAQSPDLSIDQRSIIYQGTISVRVKNVTDAAAKATGIASTAGGFIGSDDREKDAGNDTATMQLRVPAEKFAAVVQQLAGLGAEEARKLSTEDVTEQTVDLDARISVQQARVDSGRKLLASAKTLSDLVMLEREVATRESDLASLQAKKRKIADLVALSTITVTLLSEKAAPPVEKPARHGFLGGLSAGWHALTASLGVLLTVLGALLPWLLGIGVPAAAIYYLYRRMRRGRATPLRPADAEVPAAES